MYSKNKICENTKFRERQLSSEYKYSTGTLINNSTYIKIPRMNDLVEENYFQFESIHNLPNNILL